MAGPAGAGLLDEVQREALKGSWRAVLEHTAQRQPPPRPGNGMDLALQAYQVLALMKLQRYSLAADFLSKQQPLGPLASMRHPSKNPLKSWAMFTLNYLSAQLLGHISSRELCMEKLHDLMTACRHLAEAASRSQQAGAGAGAAAAATAAPTPQQQQQQQVGSSSTWKPPRPLQTSTSYDEILKLFSDVSGSSGVLAAAAAEAATDAASESADAATSSPARQPPLQQQQESSSSSSMSSNWSGTAADVAVWWRRWRFVAFALVKAHVEQQQPAAAFQLLDQLLLCRPQDPFLWTAAGRLQLQLGHLQQAEQSFARAEQGFDAAHAGQQPLPADARRTISHNRICLKVMSLDLTGGLAECEAALAGDPRDAVAASNKALCLVHLGRLTEALQLTEAGLNREPQAFLQEGILTNLGRMYDLAYPSGDNSKQARRMVASASMPLMPDDFDLSCIEPNT